MKEPAWGSPDPAGFATLLGDHLREHSGMVFRESVFRPDEIETLRSTLPPPVVQQRQNHVNLILYAEDIAVQRRWATELIASWHQDASERFPNLTLKTQISDDGAEVVVTCWAEDVLTAPHP